MLINSKLFRDGGLSVGGILHCYEHGLMAGVGEKDFGKVA